MISNNSIRVYLLINVPLFFVAYMYTIVIQLSFIGAVLFTLIRNIGIIKMIEYSTLHKQVLNANYVYPEGEFLFYVIQGSIIETTTTYLSLPNPVDENISLVLLTFIPLSFIFELIFDFFFYWSHRFLHISHLPWHKVHHEYIHLKPAITFYQDWVDILFTVSLPFFLAERIVQSVYTLSPLEYSLLVTYKIFTEISGHSGRNLGRSSGFIQCIWLPRVFSMELYTEDHNLHHRNPSCNFSKRFAFWDKMFGTYERIDS